MRDESLTKFWNQRWIAISPKCPKGGLPMSCSKHAFSTIEIKQGMSWAFRREASFNPFPTLRAIVRPVSATSNEWVKRLRTEVFDSREKTWAFLTNRLNEEEKTILEWSLRNSEQASLFGYSEGLRRCLYNNGERFLRIFKFLPWCRSNGEAASYFSSRSRKW